MSEPINYTAVLADLVARRDQLNAAIAALEQIAGVTGTGSTATPNSEARTDEIQTDTFFGLSVPQAAKKYLGMTGRRPKSPADIVEALKRGGQGQATYANVYTALKRLRAAGEVHKLPSGDWGLAEWYPGARRPAAGRRGGGETVEGEELPAEPEQD